MSELTLRSIGADCAGARIMAESWLAYTVALWSGDPAASAFAEWLAAYWQPALKSPEGQPDALSPCLTLGKEIAWFERDGWVSGHIPGQAGGYLLPRAVVLAYPWIELDASAA